MSEALCIFLQERFTHSTITSHVTGTLSPHTAAMAAAEVAAAVRRLNREKQMVRGTVTLVLGVYRCCYVVIHEVMVGVMGTLHTHTDALHAIAHAARGLIMSLCKGSAANVTQLAIAKELPRIALGLEELLYVGVYEPADFVAVVSLLSTRKVNDAVTRANMLYTGMPPSMSWLRRAGFAEKWDLRREFLERGFAFNEEDPPKGTTTALALPEADEYDEQASNVSFSNASFSRRNLSFVRSGVAPVGLSPADCAPIALLLREDVHYSIGADGQALTLEVHGAVYVQVHPKYIRSGSGTSNVCYIRITGRDAVAVDLDEVAHRGATMIDVYAETVTSPSVVPVAIVYNAGKDVTAWDVNPSLAVFNLSFLTPGENVVHAVTRGELSEKDTRAFGGGGPGLLAQFEAFPLRPLSSVSIGVFRDRQCHEATEAVGGISVHVEGTSTMEWQ